MEATNTTTTTATACNPTGTSISENVSNVLLIHEAIDMIKETVNAPETLDQSRYSPNFFTRLRKLPFTIVIYIMLCLSKHTIQAQLDNYFKDDSDNCSNDFRHSFQRFPALSKENKEDGQRGSWIAPVVDSIKVI